MEKLNSVSVIMATCNGQKFVLEQLESIARQTCLPDELIVSDDASTDDTVEIVKAFASSAPFPVKILQNERRLGYGGNFINAAKHAKGVHLSFCDQDDIWLPQKLEYALRSIEEFGADLYVHGAIVVDSTGSAAGLFSQGIGKRCVIMPLTLPPWGVFYGFSMVFRRELFDLIDANKRGGHTFEWTGSLSHDLWIYFIASSLGRIVADPEVLTMYRRHGNNATPELKGRILKRLSTYLGVEANVKLRRDAIAAHRAKILLELSSSKSSLSLCDNAKAASAYWDGISRFEADRIEIYAQDRVIYRLYKCLRLLFMGGYRPFRRGGLSWRLFLKDMLFGVIRIKRWMANS